MLFVVYFLAFPPRREKLSRGTCLAVLGVTRYAINHDDDVGVLRVERLRSPILSGQGRMRIAPGAHRVAA